MGGILVTGGTEFVSRAMACYLIGKGYEVDILTRGRRMPDYAGYREHLICDRHSGDSLKEALKGKEYDCIFDITAYTRLDVELLLARVPQRPLKKYIFCSSSAVYCPGQGARTEDSPKGSNSNWGQYGLDKLEAEEYLFRLHRESGLPVLSFRPTYIYGEGNNLYREAYLFKRIEEGKVIPVPAPSHARVQFIHIEDLCRLMEAGMNSPYAGVAYNATRAETFSWYELIEACSSVVGRDALIREVDAKAEGIEVRSFFPYRDVHVELDTSGLVRDGLDVAAIGLEEGLCRTYEWFRKVRPDIRDARMGLVDRWG